MADEVEFEAESVDADELSVHPLELFFDLVFVFAITQVAFLLREDNTAAGFARGALILTMVYWGWSLFTWGINATGTRRVFVRVGLLTAMGTILLMAIVIPTAFGDHGAYFAGAYFVYRMIGTGLYYLAAEPDQRVSLNTFFPAASFAALVALAGGFTGEAIRPWIWLVSLLIDLAATKAAERADWHVRPGHFAERYGLLVIVALGETVIAIGVGLGGLEVNLALGWTLVAAFTAVAALWWSYFDWVSVRVEDHLRRLQGIPRGAFARDAYTLLHLPLIAGIVLFSVALEEITHHPSEELDAYGRWVLAVGIVLVLFAFVLAAYRVAKRVPTERLVAAILVALVAVFGGSLAARTLIILTSAILVGALMIETSRFKRADPEGYAELH